MSIERVREICAREVSAYVQRGESPADIGALCLYGEMFYDAAEEAAVWAVNLATALLFAVCVLGYLAVRYGVARYRAKRAGRVPGVV